MYRFVTPELGGLLDDYPLKISYTVTEEDPEIIFLKITGISTALILAESTSDNNPPLAILSRVSGSPQFISIGRLQGTNINKTFKPAVRQEETSLYFRCECGSVGRSFSIYVYGLRSKNKSISYSIEQSVDGLIYLT